MPVLSALRATALAVAAVTALTLTACSSGSAKPTTPTGASAASASQGTVQRVQLADEIDHAHGLVVTVDGSLLVGTHTGIVKVGSDGSTAKVGRVDDDLMGMTGVPGTGRLITSGHPGQDTRMPNPLGLMSSQDGGLTWTPLSLAGEVDFHALATDGDVITGFDGMRGIRISSDGGKTWTEGAAVAAAALAMTPGAVWATTEDGLQRSTDGGRTFSVVKGAPVLRLLAAGSDHSLWGVDLEGYAWRSKDGTAWERRAAVGQVDAIAVDDHTTAYALTAKQLHLLT